MSILTIRNLDEGVKRELRKRAAERGVSMEQEVRDILARSVAMGTGRRKPTIEELTRLGMRPEQPFDLKSLTDEMWDEGFS